MSVITSLADPYHFDTVTDPDRGPEKIRNVPVSGFRRNFDTGPDPDGTLIRIRIRIQAKTIRIRIQAKKNSVPWKSLKFDEKTLISHVFCVYIT